MDEIKSSKEELGVGPRTEPWMESASSAGTPPLGLGTVVEGEGMPIDAGGVAVGVVLLLLFLM